MNKQLIILSSLLFANVILYSQTSLIDAIRNFKPEEAIELIKNGEDVNAYLLHEENHEHSHNCSGHDYNRSPLFWSILRSYDEVADLLIQKGANINFENAHGKTALHMAVQKYDYTMVELLLKNKADLDKIDNKGNTPVLLALYACNTENNPKIKLQIKKVIELLITNNANLNIKNNLNRSPFDFEIIRQLTH